MNFNRLTIVFSFTIWAGLVQSQNLTCNGTGYLNETFEIVKVTKDQLYGSNITYSGLNKDLFMDIYEPEEHASDERPLVIVAFGGAFITGERDTLDAMCRFYAKRGFVAVTIDYRLYDGPYFPIPSAAVITDASVKAMGDMKAAIRFFKQDAATINLYKIDTNQVFIGGFSSGAITANLVAYLDLLDTEDEGTNIALLANGGIDGNSSSNFQYSCTVAGVLSFSGAVLDTNVIDANEPPLFMVHDDQDPTVPFGSGFSKVFGVPIIALEESSLMAKRANNIGLNNSLITIKNSNVHVSYVQDGATQWKDSVINASAKFLNNTICPYFVENVQGIDPLDIVSMYPNPNNGVVNLDFGDIVVKSVRLYSVDGRMIFKDEHINSSKYKFQFDGNTGLYFIEISAQGRRKFFQIIKK